MLIITRKSGEGIIFTDDNGQHIAVVQVLGIRGATVRIGVDAVLTIGVYRDELLEKIERRERGE